MPQKTPLTLEAIDSQAGFELPARETMLVNVIITNVLNGLSIDVDVKNNKVAVQVCAIVNLLNTILVIPPTPPTTTLTCSIGQ